MEYQVWTKEEYEEGWKKVDCGDLPAAKRELEKALLQGKEPLLTAAIPYEFNIKVEEGKIGEAKASKPKPHKGTRAESEGEVRSGDTEPVQELDQ